MNDHASCDCNIPTGEDQQQLVDTKEEVIVHAILGEVGCEQPCHIRKPACAPCTDVPCRGDRGSRRWGNGVLPVGRDTQSEPTVKRERRVMAGGAREEHGDLINHAYRAIPCSLRVIFRFQIFISPGFINKILDGQ